MGLCQNTLLYRLKCGIAFIGILYSYSFGIVAPETTLPTTMNVLDTREQRIQKCQSIIQKMHELEIANQILPVMLTGEQAKKLLPTLLLIQDRLTKLEQREYATICALEADISRNLDAVHQKKVCPSQEFLQKLQLDFTRMKNERDAIEQQNFQELAQCLHRTLQPWQVVAMSNSLGQNRGREVNLENLNFFIRSVLLDPYAIKIVELIAK